MPSADDIARRAAQRLVAMHRDLPAQVEAQIRGGRPERYDPTTAIALASLVLSIAQFAWQVYQDLRKDSASPSPEVVARKVRLQVAVPMGINEGQRDQIVATVVDEIAKTSS